jgi:hypothetical protein
VGRVPWTGRTRATPGTTGRSSDASEGYALTVSMAIDHLVVGSPDLDRGIKWITDRLGVAPVFGGVHDGFGTRNALLGLGDQYLEVLALDPDQAGTSSPISNQVCSLTKPTLLTVAIAKSHLENPFSMSRVRADGVHLDWELEFTSTPLFFIDWKDCPRPSGLPDGGRITSLAITTPDPSSLAGVTGISVREGTWNIEATIDGKSLA